ncbi:hypothetical protein J6590_015814 [Homalodisca vitripennis]|nr:hypothetical protein J6590_015814 [Homalodisca vitripennis]
MSQVCSDVFQHLLSSAGERSLRKIMTCFTPFERFRYPRDPNEKILPGEVKKHSLTLNLGTNGLKLPCEPPPMIGQAVCLKVQDRSMVIHPRTSQAQGCLIRYAAITALLATATYATCDRHVSRPQQQKR